MAARELNARQRVRRQVKRARLDLDSARQSSEGAAQAAPAMDAASWPAVLDRLQTCQEAQTRCAPEQNWLIAGSAAQRPHAADTHHAGALRAGAAPTGHSGGTVAHALAHSHPSASVPPVNRAWPSHLPHARELPSPVMDRSGTNPRASDAPWHS